MIPTHTTSIFQVLLKVRGDATSVIEDWGTAFCVSYRNMPILVTARHVFMKAMLGPILPIAIRALGEDWTVPSVDVQIVAHPVADVCMVLAPNGYNRRLTTLTVSTLQGLTGGSGIETAGFLGNTRHHTTLTPPTAIVGKLHGVASATAIGRHQLVTCQSDFPGHHGLSGAPVFLSKSGEVVGIYSSGFGNGAILMDAAHILEL